MRFHRSTIILFLPLVQYYSSDALAPNSDGILNRRDALITATATLTSTTGLINTAEAAEPEVIDMSAINAARVRKVLSAQPAAVESVDMDAINAARANAKATAAGGGPGIISLSDPAPIISIRGGLDGKSSLKIPRVGYSFYKTTPDQAARCTNLALRAGVTHFDVGSQYSSNTDIAKSLKQYLNVGMPGVDVKAEKPELVELLDKTNLRAEEHSLETLGGGFRTSPPPLGSIGRRGRREELFISHKISNAEQSTDKVSVQRAVKAAIQDLGVQYLDMVSIHSPLTDKARRMATYEALLKLRSEGIVRSVGVCNYGLQPLQELLQANLDLPAVNQIELSPFNQHKELVDWCSKYSIAVSCSAWSKLSGASGPTEQWDVLSGIAKERGMTKAQVMVRWALQKGYLCVPRSAAASKLERVAIAENSYGGVNPIGGGFVLTPEEMETLDKLDVSYKAGKLGRRDGWEDSDVTGDDWDPTDYV